VAASHIMMPMLYTSPAGRIRPLVSISGAMCVTVPQHLQAAQGSGIRHKAPQPCTGYRTARHAVPAWAMLHEPIHMPST
jgi:hypothetical protein